MAGEQGVPPSMAMPAAGSADAAVVGWVGGLLEQRGRAGLAAPVAAGGGGGFRLDPERARVAVQTLTSIVDDLELALARSEMFSSAQAVGVDPVSLQLAENIYEMHRRATEYLRTWAEQVRQTRDALYAQLGGYVATEQGNAGRVV